MSERKRWWSDWPVWCCVPVLLIAAYGGAYCRIVRCELSPIYYMTYPAKLLERCAVRYSDDERLNTGLKYFFAPANSIDRKLYPSRWPGEFLRN